ncbi:MULTISPECIES: transposase domain-containing protein [Bacteroides]|nr:MULTISPECIES: transposase domain-containing protein [Bacteroides]
MHSLIESCSLNGLHPYEYLVTLLRKHKDLKEEEKLAYLSCYYIK